MIKRQPQTEVQRPLNSLKIVVARDELGEKFGSCRRPLRLLIEIEYWAVSRVKQHMIKSAFIINLRLENTSLSLAGSRTPPLSLPTFWRSLPHRCHVVASNVLAAGLTISESPDDDSHGATLWRACENPVALE